MGPRQRKRGAQALAGDSFHTIRLQVEVRFRACRAEDLEALEWMGLHSEDRSIIHATFALQQQGSALILLGDAGGFPVAQVWIDFADRGSRECPHFWAVRVFPPLQGAGLGTALLAAAERQVEQAGASRAELGVEPHNDRARAFYERLGYAPVGHRAERLRRAADGRVTRADPEQIILCKALG